jgi:regulator of protease activity HflC (stomatin/prohibitin superfamily)
MNIASLIAGFSGLLWIIAVVIVVFVVMRASRGNAVKRGGSLVLGAVLVAIVFTVLSAGIVFIQPEERGVVISALSPEGYRQQALEPGLHFVVPFFENVVLYSMSKQTYTMSIAPSEGAVTGDDSIDARTFDGQQIKVDASVIYSIDPSKVTQIHIQWQNRYGTDLVRTQARSIIRDAVSQYRAEEVVSTKRAELAVSMRKSMEDKLAANGLILDDFLIRNIQFSEEFAKSIEQKQIAEQMAQQAKFTVEQRRQEAEQARQVAQGTADAVVIAAKADAESRLIQADAEAKALQMIAQALQNNPDLLTYQYINKLSPSIQTMLVPSNSPFLLPLPQNSGTTFTTTP